MQHCLESCVDLATLLHTYSLFLLFYFCPVLLCDLTEEFGSSNAALVEAEMKIWLEEANYSIGDVCQNLHNEKVSI